MTPIAPHITAFLRERLPVERGASPHTCHSYAYAFQLLFTFAAQRLKVTPSALYLEQIDPELVLAFLGHLETVRGNSPSSRNTRLAAIKSFMHFLEHRVPSALDQIRQILAIPAKKTDTPLVCHLTLQEMKTLLDVPEPNTRNGIRDRAMLHLAFSAGLRVSELVGLSFGLAWRISPYSPLRSFKCWGRGGGSGLCLCARRRHDSCGPGWRFGGRHRYRNSS